MIASFSDASLLHIMSVIAAIIWGDNTNLGMIEAFNDMFNDATADYKTEKQIVEADFVIIYNH